MRACDHGRVSCEPAARELRRGRAPRFGASGQLCRRDLDVERPLGEVDRDDVAVAQQADRSALGRLGRHVADAESARSAREPSVGDERNGFADRHAFEKAGERQHLAHAGPTSRSFVAHDDDISFVQQPFHRGRCRRFLAVEHPRRTTERHLVLRHRAHLDHGAEWREGSEEHGEGAALCVRIVHGANTLGILVRHASERITQ